MSALATPSIRADRPVLYGIASWINLALLLTVVVVVCAPLVIEHRWPLASAEWVSTVSSVAVTVAAAAIFALGARNARALRRRLAASGDTLRSALTSGLASDEALRVSVQQRKSGARRLRVLVARGKAGQEKLRLALASGRETDDKLRVSVAHGVVSEEKLRVSVAAGIKGAEALRVSVADGIEGAEALRVSIEQGIDAATTTLAVVDTVDAAITLYAPDGHILLTNDTARTLAVLARSEELNPLEFAGDRVTPIPPFDQVLARAARGQLVTRRAYWVGVGDGQRAIMSTSQYVRRASGELIGTVVASHDVTPLARTRDEFLETVSHELRTPLTSMIGYLEILEDALDLEESGLAQEFEVVQRNTDRLLKLINDLLLTATGESPSDPRPTDVTELVINSLNSIRHLAAPVGVRLIMADSHPLLAEVDADRIGDAFDKVLSNALKFNRPGGQIEVAVELDGSDAVVRISDTGVGMAADDRQRMFERFYRAPSARVDAIAGAGLGLTTAKIIVEAHHGSITAASVLGEGTMVVIRLPRTAGQVSTLR